MALKIKYKDTCINVSVDHSELIKEVEKDIFEFGENYIAFLIFWKYNVSVPFTNNESMIVDLVSDYQLNREDLILKENEYAIKSTLKEILKRLRLEDAAL